MPSFGQTQGLLGFSQGMEDLRKLNEHKQDRANQQAQHNLQMEKGRFELDQLKKTADRENQQYDMKQNARKALSQFMVGGTTDALQQFYNSNLPQGMKVRMTRKDDGSVRFALYKGDKLSHLEEMTPDQLGQETLALIQPLEAVKGKMEEAQAQRKAQREFNKDKALKKYDAQVRKELLQMEIDSRERIQKMRERYGLKAAVAKAQGKESGAEARKDANEIGTDLSQLAARHRRLSQEGLIDNPDRGVLARMDINLARALYDNNPNLSIDQAYSRAASMVDRMSQEAGKATGSDTMNDYGWQQDLERRVYSQMEQMYQPNAGQEPPQAAIQYLRQHDDYDTIQQFNQKYGAGAANKYLSK